MLIGSNSPLLSPLSRRNSPQFSSASFFSFPQFVRGFLVGHSFLNKIREIDFDFISFVSRSKIFVLISLVLLRPSMGKNWKKGEDEDRLRLRHKFLMQDYKQLWRETEAKKKRLIISTKKKLELLTEIKFLRRKLRSFSENPYQKKQFKLKIRYSDDMLSSLQLPILEEPANLREDFLDKIQEERESENAIIPQMFDLNQIYLAYNDDDTYKHMGSNMPPDDNLANEKSEISVKDSKLVKFRDAKNGENRVKWSNPVVSMVHHLPLH